MEQDFSDMQIVKGWEVADTRYSRGSFREI